MTITKKEFAAYVKVQMSGVTNMLNLDMVSCLSGLSRKKLLYIMDNYSDLDEKWGTK